MQLSLFPVSLVQEEPVNLGTAQLKRIGHDENGRKYAIKSVLDDPLLPLTELFCYELCRVIGIETPNYAKIVCRDGSVAFGSVWDTDSTDLTLAKLSLPDQQIMLSKAANSLSAAMALAFFLPDSDRHYGNFLYRKAGNHIAAMAFDWSHVTPCLKTPVFSWTLEAAQALMPEHQPINTLAAWKYLKTKGLWRPAVAARTLDKLKEAPDYFVDTILAAADPSWIPPDFDRAGLSLWWNQNRHARIEECRTLLI